MLHDRYPKTCGKEASLRCYCADAIVLNSIIRNQWYITDILMNQYECNASVEAFMIKSSLTAVWKLV